MMYLSRINNEGLDRRIDIKGLLGIAEETFTLLNRNYYAVKPKIVNSDKYGGRLGAIDRNIDGIRVLLHVRLHRAARWPSDNPYAFYDLGSAWSSYAWRQADQMIDKPDQVVHNLYFNADKPLDELLAHQDDISRDVIVPALAHEFGHIFRDRSLADIDRSIAGIRTQRKRATTDYQYRLLDDERDADLTAILQLVANLKEPIKLSALLMSYYGNQSHISKRLGANRSLQRWFAIQLLKNGIEIDRHLLVYPIQ